VRVDGPRQWLHFRRDEVSAADVVAAVAARAPLKDLALEEPAIEDVVRRIYVDPPNDSDRPGDGPGATIPNR
jgi:ABC-2 type transport system ATP-binding protein